MTDTREFNKSLDRIAKALGGEEWSPEDKPEAIYKLLDKIADKLEENGMGGGAEPLIIETVASEDRNRQTMLTLAEDVFTAFKSGRVCIVNMTPQNIPAEVVYPSEYAPMLYMRKGSDGDIQAFMYIQSGNNIHTWYVDSDGYLYLMMD